MIEDTCVKILLNHRLSYTSDKVEKVDACIRPLFTNPVTNIVHATRLQGNVV